MTTPFSDFSAAPGFVTNAATAGDALIIFCRAPRLGQVKTRLARARGDEFALRIYRAMLRDCFDLGRALAPQVETFACFTPDNAFNANSALREFWDGPALAQRGADLGARMLDALNETRAKNFERCIVIGSDAPDLPQQHLCDAFDLLRENQVVVGPSGDGGFVLIGASCALPAAIFANIAWSRADVCARLLENLRALDLSFAVLAPWHDVDDAADLDALRARLQNGADANVALATREILAVRT